MGIKDTYYIGKGKIICSWSTWQNMDRELAIKKECQERKKNPPKLHPLQKKLLAMTLVDVT